MSEPTFDIGDKPRVRAEFVDLSGNPGNPDAVVFTVRPPNTVAATTITGTHVSTGIYDCYVDLTSHGRWGVRAVGTGALQAAVEAVIQVRRSEVT